MNKKVAVIIFLVVLVLQSCRFESKRSVSTSNEVFIAEDYIGLWVKENANKEMTLHKEGEIYKILLKKDYKAEVELQGANGNRTINGGWEIHPNLKITNVSLQVDMLLTFDRAENHREKLMLSIQKEDNQIVLSSHKSKFKKAN